MNMEVSVKIADIKEVKEALEAYAEAVRKLDAIRSVVGWDLLDESEKLCRIRKIICNKEGESQNVSDGRDIVEAVRRIL